MARASVYLGSPPRARLHRALLGDDIAVFDDLPVGLGRVVASGLFGPADLHGAVHEWTVFPYYAHYVAPSRAEAAARVMAETGRWAHEVLGSWSLTVPPPNQLRFCLECREDMLAGHADLWWRRAHQLPSALMCPDHGEPLHESTVNRAARRSDYVAANLDLCRTDAPRVVDPVNRRVRGDLVALARVSDALLDRECDQHPDDRREGYLRRLAVLGLLNRAGEANLARVASALDGYWGETLDIWPGLTNGGRCAQGWLGALLWGRHGRPPLHHLLLDVMLAARIRF